MRIRVSILFAGYLGSLITATHALQADQAVLYSNLEDRPSVKRVAVIGAGSAGSSAAHYLRKYSDDLAIPVNITIFERNAYIGGRSTTANAYDDPLKPVELGASIFVEVNRNLVQAAKEFNLSTSSLSRVRTRLGNDAPILGVWNGNEFVVTQSAGNSWWNNAKLLWKYGLAPVRTMRLMRGTVSKFFSMYDEPYFPFADLTQVAYDLGLTAVTAVTGEQYLREHGIADLFAREVIQASTRVNYAQNLPLIHGLETMVCMATDGAMAVEGGNWQMFEGMVQASRADVRLHTQVTALDELENGTCLVRSTTTDSATAAQDWREELFDTIILAAPYQFSNITINSPLAHVPDKIPYVTLHVTLFASPHLLSPAAFNLPPGQAVPQIILTTLPADEPASARPDGVGSPGFFSISLLQPTMNDRHTPPRPEYLYKIFSPDRVNATFLSRILGLEKTSTPANDDDDDPEISADDVSWLYRKVWQSYPYEYPRVTFEKLRLSGDRRGEGIWYTAGIESLISTMETSSLMGMNVARLIADEWVEEGKEEKVRGLWP
ncbi:hypothetical protein LTR50_005952 [Elasticomyces elasticus]|nr:hypothetical protein LTR50_005952 [Elasticomyces elasticus]